MGVPLGLLLGARSWICCFSEVRVRILKIPFSYSPLLLMLGTAFGYGWTSYGANFFSKELPTCAITYDVLLELPPHITDATFKSSSLKAFLEKGQIPEFSNPAKVFFIIHENACNFTCEIRTMIFFLALAIIQSFCATVYFALKGSKHQEAVGDVFSGVGKWHRIFS